MNRSDETFRVRSPAQLPKELLPRRDLWPGIAARIAVQPPRQPRITLWPLGLAAAIALFGFAAWIGRSAAPNTSAASVAARANAVSLPGALRFAASYALDQKSSDERQQRLHALAGQLGALPDATRLKVSASLQAIEKSMIDIQAALGRDPGNLLLQELLVSSYQDEMRVLGAVDEAKSMTQGRTL